MDRLKIEGTREVKEMFKKAMLFLGGVVVGASGCLAAAALLPPPFLAIDMSDLDMSKDEHR